MKAQDVLEYDDHVGELDGTVYPKTTFILKLSGEHGDRRRIEHLARKIRRLVRKEKRGK